MLRRVFFRRLLAAVGVVAVPTSLAASYQSRDRDPAGELMADAFVRQPSGEWLLTRREEVKAGDEMIMLGCDGRKMFLLKRLTVGEHGVVYLTNGHIGVQPIGNSIDLTADNLCLAFEGVPE